VANAFVTHYYTLFDSSRGALKGLYRDGSILSFEGELFVGAEAIATKLTTLKFSSVAHRVKSIDAMPSGASTVLVLVCGELIVDGGAHPLIFTQMFHLVPVGSEWYVHNDVFRLNYG